MRSRRRVPLSNPQPDVPVESIGGDATAVAVALDHSPRRTATTEVALDSLPANHRNQARRQIAAFGADGWFNPETLMGVEGADPSVSTRYQTRGPWDFVTLEYIYRGEGIGRKCIDIPIAQMLRRTFELKGDTDGEAVSYLRRRRVLPALKSLATNGNLFGGALGVMLVKDGMEDLEEPLDLRKIDSFEGLNVFDRWQVAWYTDSLYRNPTNPKFMQPRRYQIFPIYGAPFWVHESRVVRWDGAFIPERSRQQNNGWMDSTLQPMIDKLMMLGDSMAITKTILRTIVIQVLAMKGLGELIKGDKKATVESRMRNLRKWMSVANIVPIDGEDKYTKESSSIQGVPQLLDRQMQWVAADGPVPYSILFGKLTGSLGGGKDDDVQLRMFYDGIRDDQVGKYAPVLERILEVASAAKDFPAKAKIKPGESPEVDFPPLTEPNEDEISKTRLATAQADEIYLNAGVFSPDEIRQARAGGDRYSAEYKARGKAPRPEGVPAAVKPGDVPAAGAVAPPKKKKPAVAA